MNTLIRITLIVCGSVLMALPLVMYCLRVLPKHGYDAISLIIILFPLTIGFMMMCMGAMQDAGECGKRKARAGDAKPQAAL
jgi:hypothetical protein